MASKRNEYKAAYSVSRLLNDRARKNDTTGFALAASVWQQFPVDVIEAVQNTNERRFDRIKTWRNQTWQDWFEECAYRRQLARREP